MSGQKRCCFTLIAGLLLLCLTSPVALAARPEVRDLVATSAALKRMQREYAMMYSAGALNGAERREFELYLQHLSLRIAEQCRQLLIRYPEIQPSELPCPLQRGMGSLPAEAADDGDTGEDVAELDAVLADGLAEFDEMLLREQELSPSQVPRARVTVRDQQPGQDKDPERRSQAGGQGQPDSEATDASAQRTTGSGEQRDKNTPRQEKSTDGSGDDVVARQLREAAEKEQDPALKKKLWEEYRRYKASI